VLEGVEWVHFNFLEIKLHFHMLEKEQLKIRNVLLHNILELEGLGHFAFDASQIRNSELWN